MRFRLLAFTLFELIIVVAISSILFVVAVPTYKTLLARNYATTTTNRIVSAINFARYAAITNRNIVTMCPTSNGVNCGGAWNKGILIFIDSMGSGKFSNKDIKLRSYGPLKEKASLSWNRTAQYIQISPSGYLKSQNGTFFYRPKNGGSKYIRKIAVSKTGRTRIILAP